ncbi:ion channel [Ferruginibacter albus]|uniref:ion channel n=1 Tax=Ferruginibacter albus TaxID=2875540 RepID=UPI001CC6052D|nr:ion channel [Ferruginibacter albus]UAY50836.1 transporter [Ferruginibacter albus]
MSRFKRSNPFSKVNNDTGFGANVTNNGGRYINRDGSFNIRKEGMPAWERFSIYHSMLNMSRWKFFITIILTYFSINLIYTFIYLLIGPQQLQGLTATTSWQLFKEVFYFSTETFTTVGYGRVNPIGDAANLVAAIEAMSGFLSFAVATGLIYGRFSKPKSYLVFSKQALISPFRDKTALMFRFASYKDKHVLTDVEIQVNIGLKLQDNPDKDATYKYFNLPLERSRVENMPMNWTVVHPIDEQSPLWGFSVDDMIFADVEVYVLVRGFDDTYSSLVLQRTSYTFQEIIFHKKFVPMYRESDEEQTTILELHKLNELFDVKL